MKIGVLSDTHGDIWAAEEACRMLRNFQVSLAIHCGDVGESVPGVMRGLPCHFVCGNTDNADELREETAAAEHVFHENFGTLEFAGRKVAVLHGHDAKLLRETIRSGQWDLVCTGHSHVFSHHFEGRTLVLNPGALFRTKQPSVAVVEMPSLEVTEVRL